MKLETFLTGLRLFFLIAIMAMFVVIALGLHTKWTMLKDELHEAKAERAQLIEKVKTECEVVHKLVNRDNVDVTYRCDDGVEYSFVEWF